jgi:small conductance mechanosensitive channel
MGLFATNMETGDGIFISVPNSCLWGLPLKNFSRSTRRRVDITVTISYYDSIDTAFQVLRDIIAQENRFLKEPVPQVLVQSLGESGIGVTLRAWTPSASFMSVLNDQMKNVKEKIQEAGLNFSFPQRGIHIVTR